MAGTDRLLNVNQVAKRLTLAPSTVYGLIQEGKLKSLRMAARSVQVRESEVERYISQCAAQEEQMNCYAARIA